MLVLTVCSCTGGKNEPAESSNTKPKKETSIEVPKRDASQEPASKSSIDTADPSNDPTENDSEENETMSDPKEALTKILMELQELDELLNGTN